jgi:hypothetical protein
MNSLLSTVSFALALALAGCGPSFKAGTPPGFLELEDPGGHYDYRATTADGLVIAARELDNPESGELSFWSRAIENELRSNGGYALLASRSVTSKDGVRGTELRFGHDQGDAPHLYYLAVFVTPSKLCLVEAGGKKDLVARHEKEIAWAFSQFAVD